MIEKKISYSKLLEYMKIVFDMEQNIYIQEKTMEQLKREINSLGYYRRINSPKKDWVDPGMIAGGAGCSLLSGLSVGFISFICFMLASCKTGIKTVEKWNESLHSALITGLIIAGSIFIIGLIISICGFIGCHSDAKSHYNKDMASYNNALAIDQQRVSNEMKQKAYLSEQYNLLYNKYCESKERLKKFYNEYDILDNSYRNDIIAVSTIYQYLKRGQTRSLAFDPSNGDRGAYNLYEEALRFNKLITNTEIIIKKLDVVIDNQNELQTAMRNATNQINHLVTGTNKIAAALGNVNNQLAQANRNSEIQVYNQNRAIQELKHANWLKNLYH